MVQTMTIDEEDEKFENWMTAAEVAEWFGVSKRVLSSNRIPSAEMGGNRFYHKRDVARFLAVRRDRDR